MNIHKTGTTHKTPHPTTPRDLLAILFRQHRAVAISFVVIFSAVALVTFLKADRYTARMLILVENDERADPVVSARPDGPSDVRASVTEAEIRSEAALLESHDLLEQVVVACGLDSVQQSRWHSIFGGAEPSRDIRLSLAVRRLASKLKVQIPERSNVISVSYSSSNAQVAAHVLRVLGNFYLKKNVAVHRPSTAVEFFREEQNKSRQQMEQADEDLIQFSRKQGVVAAELETAGAVHELNNFQEMQAETQADIAQTQRRIGTLEAEEAKISPRMTTQIKTSDNPQLIEQLKTTLLNLELQRTALLEKFAPDYRPVKEVERQVEQTKAALASAEAAPWREETTDTDPTFELVREEITKAQADLAGLEARKVALQRAGGSYQTKAEWLLERGVQQQNLMRNVKAAEDNYTLYQRKYGEAQVSNALDNHHILNVTVAEAATIPVLPDHSNSWYLLVAATIALLGSAGLAFATDYLDPTFRSSDEVESLLDLPIVATIAAKGNGHAKGNGNGGIGVHVS